MPVSTRKHLEALREADQRAIDIALAAAKERVDTAKKASDEHLAVNNNVLDGWKTDRGTFATKEDLAAAVEKIESVRASALLNTRTFAVALLAIVAGVLANAGVFG